jgi:Spy/CpxP family protein refolding chaperone
MRSNREALAAAAPTDADYPGLIATEKANAAKLIEEMSAVKTQIYAVLTPAQIKQIPQILAADKAKWQERQQNSGPGATTSTPATSS